MQICALYNSNDDWKNLAETLRIQKSTSYLWVNYLNVAKRPSVGERREKITENHCVFIVHYIEDNPRLTSEASGGC